MRFSFAIATIVTLLLNGSTGFAQTRDLQLTTSLSRQQRCAASAGVDVLRLTLQLRYTNAGRQKLILYKGNRLFFQIFISRSGQDELRATHARYFDEQLERMTTSTPGSAFTILSPGAAYETKEVISVPVARDGNSRFNVSIAPGEHVLNVVSSTWYESKKLADELRERWRSRGLLWTAPIASGAITFAVDQNGATVACQ